ncbi:pyrroline-5-carboxylate reductase [Erythrobacter sp. HKB08]|uniref:pyrroline-5-carboxylate reductase family protein n=1 Tax=Erythrobacter sp. HKB08 TaxID=2502843 RepID=UPI0010090F68|nr:pyrroline-5-carboxylate reductase [Erythrobacter sp. HKB08]
MTFSKMLIVGYGTMTGAMVEGWLRAGHSRDSFEVYHPTKTEVERGLAVHNTWPEAQYDFVLLGVKPHMIDDVAGGIAGVCGANTAILSVLAGVELDSLASRFPSAGGVVRFMPNLAVAIGKSPNALMAKGIGEETRAEVTKLASDLGTAEWIEDEALFDLVTALAGSGPGFVYRFIDALAAGATRLGLPAEQAERLAVAMVDGAGSLAAGSEHSPRELARRVASPGGMTQKGLDVLDEGSALQELVTECLRAARDRGREMADSARKNG